MASVELRPGDTLNIVWSSVQDTPLGTKEVESSFAFSYEELLQRLKARGQAGKSRRSGTVGAKFSRFVALATNAIRKGKWSTGADLTKGRSLLSFWNVLQFSLSMMLRTLRKMLDNLWLNCMIIRAL